MLFLCVSSDRKSNLRQWFYDESSETAILRCLPCFKIQLTAKPTLASLTPLKAQRALSSSSSGTLAAGMFFKKQTTRNLINSHNAAWYRQKNACIEHLCLIGGGSKCHKKAIEAYNKELKIAERKSNVAKNIFRVVVVDVELAATGIHFEILLSFHSLCSADVGSIRHGRNNFNHILCCIENAVDTQIEA